MKSWFRFTALVCAAVTVTACKEKPAGPDDGDTLPDVPGGTGGTTVMAAGNIAVCTNNNDEITAQLIDTVPGATVIALGDNAFPGGTAQAYNDCYGPSWGRFKDRTYATLGNHDWDAAAGNFAGAAGYFGDRAGPAGKHFYSFNVGTWHVAVLNVISGTAPPVPYDATSEQQAWLAADLQANADKKCVMVVWHDPRFMSSANDPTFLQRSTQTSLWSRLEAAGVDVVLNGNQHWYERMNPMRSDGSRDDENGIMQFIVGTGGESVIMPTTRHPESAAVGASYGVLKLNLRDGAFDWQFQAARGQAPVDDAGSRNCH